jgi:hypothetical protein
MGLDSIALDYMKTAKEIYAGKFHLNLLEKSRQLDNSSVFLHKIYKTPEYRQWMDFVGALHDQNFIAHYTHESNFRRLDKNEKRHMRDLDKNKELRKSIIEEMLRKHNLLN